MIYRSLPFSALTSSLAFLAACNARLALEDPPITETPDAGPLPHEYAGPIPTLHAPGDCNDRFINGDETDVDCGGPACPSCPVEASCTGHSDCESKVCRAGTCQTAACDDATQNGNETGVDCGGSCTECPVPVVPCECASSPNLTGLACGPSLTPDEPTHLTQGGESVLFNLSRLGAHRWDGSSSTALDTGSAASRGISNDGRLMLFQSYDGTNSFVLTADGNRTELPFGTVIALSEDGSVVLSQGFRWTTQGLEEITDGSGLTFSASFMTADGAVVGGRREFNPNPVQLFTWSGGNAVQLLGTVPSWYTRTRNNGVVISRDGNVIAGFISTSLTGEPDDTNQIFRWTQASGISVVTPLWPSNSAPDDRVSDTRLWLNDDGSAMVGTFDLDAATGAPEPSAFRWTEATGPVALAATPGQQSIVRDASRDLGVVVGYTIGDGLPFVWTEADGLRQLGSVLGDVDQTGWALHAPVAVSRDGRVVVGEGLCNGVPAVYRAVLPD